MTSGRRAVSARLASGTSLLVLAGTSMNARPAFFTAAASWSRLNTEFDSEGTNSVPTLFTDGTTLRITWIISSYDAWR